MVKHPQTICRLLPTNRLSVFDYFVGLGLKALSDSEVYSEPCQISDMELSGKIIND